MLANTFRRSSTMASTSVSQGESSKRPSVSGSEAMSSRKSSIARLPLRLTRSKRSQSSSVDTQEQTSRLGEHIFALPPEIQSIILTNLDLADIFALRLTSTTTLAVLQTNASSITRSILTSTLPPTLLSYILTLNPLPTPLTTLTPLLHHLRRSTLTLKQITHITTFIQMKIYMIKTGPRIERFSLYRDRLSSLLLHPAWTLHHFLTTYRHLLTHTHAHHHPPQPKSKPQPCPSCTLALTHLIASYPAPQLIPLYQFLSLTLLHLRASSRAPSYAGTIERRLRGWSRKPPSSNELACLLVLGGYEQLTRVSIMKGTYNQRLEIIGGFLDKVEGGGGGASGVSSDIQDKKKNKARQGVSEAGVQEGGDVMAALDTPYDAIDEAVLESLPALDEVLAPGLRRRIEEEGLLSELDEEARERELASPFPFVQRVMAADQDGAEGSGGGDDGEGGQWQYHVFTNYG